MKTSTIVLILVALVVVAGAYWIMRDPDAELVPSSITSTTTDGGGLPLLDSTTTGQGMQNGTSSNQTASSSATSSRMVSVTIQNNAYSSSTLTVKQGTTVVWTNRDTASHTVTGTNGGPSSSALSFGETYRYTFNTVGTFPYYCTVHPDMRGRITVTR